MAVQKWVDNDRFLLRISLRNGHSLAIHANTNLQCEWTLRHRKLLLSLSCDGHVVSLPQMDTFQCSCPSGFTGQRCQHNVNECDVMPCQNGTCRDQDDNRICECFHGYTGSLHTHIHAHMITGSASVSRDTQVRYLHTCTHTHDQMICECFPGYTGSLLTHMYTHTWSEDLRVFPGIHRFVTYTHVHTHMIRWSASVSQDTQVRYLHTCTRTHDQRTCECFQGYTGSLLTHMYTHTWSDDLRVFPRIHRFATYTHVHAHMITGSASVSRDTQVRYLHTCTRTHDQMICECFPGYTGLLLTHMYTHTWSEDLRVFPGYTGSLLTHMYTHTWSEDLRVFPGIHRFVTYTHVHAHMIRGPASVSRDTQVRYLHTCTRTHDQRTCECFQGYTGSLLTHMYIHTWSEDLRVFPGIHRFVTYTHVHAHMITGSASVSRDTKVRYLHIHTCTHDHRICHCFQGYTG